MFCSWGTETQLQPLGQLSAMCPHCRRNTFFTCFEVVEKDNVCAIPCGSKSKGKFAQCNVCGIQFAIDDTVLDEPEPRQQHIPQPKHETQQQSVNATYENAKKMYKNKRFEDSLDCINSCLDISPDNEDYWNLRGVTLANMLKYEEALLSFDRASELSDNDPAIQKNRELCLKKLREKK